jgi:hypothetical protein
LSLLLSSGRKNCAAMSHSTGVSAKSLYAFLSQAKDYTQEIEDYLFSLAKKTRIEGVTRTLIIDPSTIIKNYAQKIENVSYDRSGCTKHVERCLVPIHATVADKNITLPLKLNFWVQEKIIGKRRYKSKIELTIELIEYLIDKGIQFDFISLDGAYAVAEILAYFKKKKSLFFSIRIPSNRLIETDDGINAQLKNHPALKLKRNEREKTIQAKLKGETYFFTIQKRQARSGWERVFIISNMTLTAKEHIAAFDLRWPIEKANRTNKQKFGASQCQAVSASKQMAHIMAGFLVYAILSSSKNDKMTQSVDELVNIIRDSHFDELVEILKKPTKGQRQLNNDPIAKSIQKPFQNFSSNDDQFIHARC